MYTLIKSKGISNLKQNFEYLYSYKSHPYICIHERNSVSSRLFYKLIMCGKHWEIGHFHPLHGISYFKVCNVSLILIELNSLNNLGKFEERFHHRKFCKTDGVFKCCFAQLPQDLSVVYTHEYNFRSTQRPSYNLIIDSKLYGLHF